MWKRLKHPNVVSLLGATLSPLQLISNWMPNGDLPEYIRNHPEANPVQLVGHVALRFSRAHVSIVIRRCERYPLSPLP